MAFGKQVLFFLLRIWFRLFPKGFVYFGHGVAQSRKDSFIERIHFPADQLEEVIDFWKKLGFRFVAMDELKEMAQNEFRFSRPWVHFTFDDGYQNNLTVALPIFSKHRVPFSVFVSTHQVQTGKRFDTFIIRAAIYHTIREVRIPYLSYVLKADAGREERVSYIRMVSSVFKRLEARESRVFVQTAYDLLNHDEWQKLFDDYRNDIPLTVGELVQLSESEWVTVGSHGVDHAIHNNKHLKNDCIHEVTDSKKWLESTLGKPVDTFAFPNGGEGDFSDDCLLNCSDARYKMVFTTLKEPVNADVSNLKIPRQFLSGDCQGLLKWLIKH